MRDDYVQKQRRSKSSTGEQVPSAADKEPHDRGVLWVQDGAFVRPVKVRIGLSDGLMTEIVAGDLPEGASIVVGEGHTGGSGGTKNPFAPKLFGGNKQQ